MQFMKTSLKATAVFYLCFLTFAIPGSIAAQNGSSYEPGVVMMKLKAHETFLRKPEGVLTSGLPEVDAIVQRYGALDAKLMFEAENADQNLRTSLGLDRIYVLHFPPTTDAKVIAAELSRFQDVEYAEPNFSGHGAGVARVDSVTPNDTYFSRQWAFQNTGSNLTANYGKQGADIKATSAWEICKGDTNIIVAVLDTGLKLDHPDITDRVWVNKKEIAGNGVDDDGNGYIDDVHGWNFAYGNNNPSDDYGHGTNVASIIGAKANNGLGYTGLDWACRIMPLKEIDSSNFGYYSWWESALYYAANNGARIINMSEGGTDSSPTLKAAIDYAYAHGCFIAVAMMNTNDSTRYYPAAYHDHAVAVGATDVYDNRCNPFFWGGGSNYGSWIDVVAPGNIIFGLNNKSDSDYNWYWGGTSQATPMVCGLASLLLAQDSTRTPSVLREIIRATADDTVGLPANDTPGYDVYYGYGRINCYKALTYSPTQIATKGKALPGMWMLYQNYPNPFNPTTTICFALPVRSPITLSIYDLLGRKVTTLVNETLDAGYYDMNWNAQQFASGMYFYRFQAGKYVETKKLVLLK